MNRQQKDKDASMREANRIKVQAEINSHPLVIDRSVFAKTAEEKEALKLAKRNSK